MGKKINELGNKYGSLTVIDEAYDKNGRSAWLCQCDCGNTKIVRGTDLRKNKITHCSRSCPCKTNPRFIDETNNKYGFLTVLYKSNHKSPSQKTLWHCKCQCGNEIDILGESLRQGLTKSCGCMSKELNRSSHIKNLVNQTFGYLTVLELTDKKSNTEGAVWRCKCSCGCNRDDIYVPTHRLTTGNTQSCGKLKRSHGELCIEEYLKKHNIIFQQEYSFNDLKSNSNKKLRYDFAIFKNNILFALIEFDGEQHFKPIEYFGGLKKFKEQIEYDKKKNEYCKNNNIHLLRIKYDESIEEKLDNFLKELNF